MTKNDTIWVCRDRGSLFICRHNMSGAPKHAVQQARMIDEPLMDGSYIYQQNGQYFLRTNRGGSWVGDRPARPVDFTIYPVCLDHRRSEWDTEFEELTG